MVSRARIIIAIVAAILVIIVVLQNTQTVETKLLFVTLTMPRAVLLFVTLLVGFALGLITATWFSRRPPKKEE
ncbi:MAG: LapA family protein [Phycisphaerae bacterium]